MIFKSPSFSHRFYLMRVDNINVGKILDPIIEWIMTKATTKINQDNGNLLPRKIG